MAIGHGRWTRKAARRQVRHQLCVIRQLRNAHVLKQRQHIFTPRSGDKIICILYARQNALHVLQITQRIVFQPLGQLRARDCCVDRHECVQSITAEQSAAHQLSFNNLKTTRKLFGFTATKGTSQDPRRPRCCRD